MTEPRIPDERPEPPRPPAAGPERDVSPRPRERTVDDRVPATERILRATARGLVERGAASLSMQEVADSAGVSKGLIHYHYHDKAALLVRAVTWMADGLVERETAALDDAEAATAVEALWRWLSAELARGDIRALVELAYDPNPGVCEAVREAAMRRRAAAAVTVETLFSTLGLRPRIPVPLLAEVLVAFIDGLALSATLHPDADRRVAFDVFWLSQLSLAE